MDVFKEIERYCIGKGELRDSEGKYFH